MKEDSPNPYRDASLRTLRDRAMVIADQLLKGGRPGRRDVAYLLIALGRRVAPDDAQPNAPYRMAARAEIGFVEAFWPAYEDLRRHALYQILVQAMDASGEPLTAINRYLPRLEPLTEEAVRLAFRDLEARAVAQRTPGQPDTTAGT